MAEFAELPPIAWPSLSDLARLVGKQLSTFSRLESVRRAGRPRVGREVKISPTEAVAILEQRGLSRELAREQVTKLVRLRLDAVPAIRDAVSAEGDGSAALTPFVVGAQRSARLMPAGIQHRGRVERINKPDMGRFARRDREFGQRCIPLEQYIYERR